MAYLNPYDFLLWLSEELESSGWDQIEKEWAIPIGAGLNVIFLIARANTQTQSEGYDDVFGEASGTGWATWLASQFTFRILLSDGSRLPSWYIS